MSVTKSFHAKKNLGQHFLVDPAVRKRIIESCDLDSGDTILEIGPGKGAITSMLAGKVKHVFAIDTDQRCIDHLAKELTDKNITLIKDDILRFPLETLPSPIKVVSNLPYNIATPVIERLLERTGQFRSIYIMVQLEYGQRITAAPGTKDYGSFSCFVQYFADTELLFRISPRSFRPAPKVHSCFLKITTPARHGLKARDEELLFRVIRQAFQQRRKKMINSLSLLIDKDRLLPVLDKLKISEQCRAEQLSLEQFVDLANELKRME
jgi:16S rRNA (adenine1518-N6/adenine1519-N6)-dimethyltransferase